MVSVLIDNWTLHNVCTILDGSCNVPSQRLYDDFENLLMALLLWDDVFYWDNGKAFYWKYVTNTLKIDLPIKPIEGLSDSFNDLDLVGGWGREYQILANNLNIDYLPEQIRYKSLKLFECDQSITKINLPKYCIEKIKEGTQTIYDMIGAVSGTKLQFEFPLLLDYLKTEAKTPKKCIELALMRREEKPFINMRKWLNDLHSNINSGNWLKVKKSFENVCDIVPYIYPNKKPIKTSTISIGILPAPAIGTDFDLDIEKIAQKHNGSLAFLRDLAKFALSNRPPLS